MGADTESSPVGNAEVKVQHMLLSILRAMADYPDQIHLELISDEEGDVFQVEATPADLGRLIGKNGQTARALRLIVNANAKKTGRRFDIEFGAPPEDRPRG